jgi:hypothetical protein
LTRFAHNNGYGFLTARVPALDLEPAGEGACYQPAYVSEAEPPDLGYVPVPGGDGSPAGWLGRHQQAAANHQVYAGWSDGTQVVGHNNVGEIRFEAGAAAGDPPRAARQTLHWRRAPGEAVQSTHYRASLELEPLDCD